MIGWENWAPHSNCMDAKFLVFLSRSYHVSLTEVVTTEAVTQKCSWEKVFWKYAANLQENTHAGVWFQ